MLVGIAAFTSTQPQLSIPFPSKTPGGKAFSNMQAWMNIIDQ
jgi:hypothetical protein